MWSSTIISRLFIIGGILSAHANTQPQLFKPPAPDDGTLQFMPESVITFMRTLMILRKTQLDLARPFMKLVDTALFRSFPEALHQVREGLADYGNRRSGEEDPITNSDLNWEETKCLLEEYGILMPLYDEEIEKKYWSKGKRCGDI